MNNTAIEWTDLTWNPIEGCDKISPGCKFCYAATMWKRFNGKRPFSDVKERPDRLKQPLLIKSPKKIFIDSASDLFHENISFHYIRRVFMLMYSPGGNHHTYQILTKRAERMLQFFEWLRDSDNIIYQHLVANVFNIWIGVSVENQEYTSRLDFLTNPVIPASFVKFISYEPALGPVNFHQWLPQIDWIICGGESGSSRPIHPEWVRSVRDQCASAGVPFFFKQWGQYYTDWVRMTTEQPVFKMYTSYLQFTQKLWVNKGDKCIGINGKLCKIGKDFQDPEVYPVAIMKRMKSKKISGNTIDGKQHLEFPQLKIK